MAHGDGAQEHSDRELVAVFASPVAERLLRYAADAGFRVHLLEPDAARAEGLRGSGVPVLSAAGGWSSTTDVVVTDHHRAELGPLLRDVLAGPVRWIGVMGNPRHEGPHVRALRELGVAEEDIARVHRPIGLDIGSRAPAEIAIATVAGLLADRNGRAGGFHR
ncbi:XdhC family protein [Salinifilum aidingensis]